MTNWVMVLFIFCVLTSAACGRHNLSDLPVEYTRTLGQLGFQPVYPPREGFQVGDVYFRARHRINPYDPRKNFNIFVGSIRELIKMSQQFAESRMPFEDTLNNNVNLDKQYDFRIEDLRYQCGPDSNSENECRLGRRRMLQLAFPSVTARLSRGIGAGPFESLLNLIGTAARSEYVTVSFPDVRYMRAPLGLDDNLVRALGLFADKIYPFLTSHRRVLRTAYNYFPGCGDKDYVCEYVIVSTVYYARALKYTFGDGSSFSMSLGSVGNSADGVNDGAEDVGPDNEGLSLAESRSRTFEITQTFVRPIAVAWEGYQVSVSELASLSTAEPQPQ